MGPGRERPGRPITRHQSEWREELQWGQGASALEDNIIRERRDRGRLSFNGARARAPWKTSKSSSAISAAVLLQWGQGASALEDGNTIALYPDGTELQWGQGAS